MSTPQEIDTKLAELFHGASQLDSRRTSAHQTLLDMAGAQFYYRGRRRVTDMTVGQAISKLSANPDHRDLSWGRTNREILAEIAERDAEIEVNRQEISKLQDQYTGWSRFFVVTSSAGHIHSSMHCHTCRPTTTYGWLPHLSGKSQSEAIKHFGPAATALCSVCFPDAPVERMDENLTNKQREDLLAGRTPEAQAKKEYCPGSGQRSTTPIDWRRYYKSGKCPHCAYVGAVTQSGTMRKHKEAK